MLLPDDAVSSAGDEAIDFAAKAGLILDPWQRWVLRHALGERADGKWSAFEVALIVSRQNGKGAILEARELAGLFLFGEQLIIHTAHEFKTSSEAFRRIWRLIEQTPDLDRMVARVSTSHGGEGVELVTGQRLRFLARSQTSGRGFTGDVVIWDEAMPLDADDVAATLPTLSTRDFATEAGPQAWYTASAGNEKSTQLALVRDRAIRGIDTEGLFLAEYSIDPCTPDCDPDGCTLHDDPRDPASWAKSNPGLGYIHADGSGLTTEAIARELRSTRGGVTFLRERCGVGTYPQISAGGWKVIPKLWWEACLDHDAPRPVNPALAVHVCSAPSMARSVTSIGIAGLFGGPVWRGGEPVPGGVVRVEVVDRRPGTSWAIGRLAELAHRWRPCAVVMDTHSETGSLLTEAEDAHLTITKINTVEVGHAFGQFYDAVKDGRISQGGDPDLDTAMAAAVKRRSGLKHIWDEQGTPLDISHLVAVTFAHWAYLKFASAGDYDAADSVHFDLDEIVRLCKIGVYGPADIARLYSNELIDADGLTRLAAEGIRVPAGLA